jgi:hypothetical protein
MAVPARRFQPPTAPATPIPVPVPTIQAGQPLTIGPTEVTRRVSASGLIGVCYQQVSAGRPLAGQVVTVRLHPACCRSSSPASSSAPCPAPAPRRSSNSAPTDPTSPNDDPQPTRDVSTITRNQTRKHQPELDTSVWSLAPACADSTVAMTKDAPDPNRCRSSRRLARGLPRTGQPGIMAACQRSTRGPGRLQPARRARGRLPTPRLGADRDVF